MASAKFLEEALSTDVDESAVNAIVGSLENQLVTSTPPISTHQVNSGSVNQNHQLINSGNISNGGTATIISAATAVQKHGVANGGSATSMNNLVITQDTNKSITTTNLLPVNVVTSSTIVHTTSQQQQHQQQQQHTQSSVIPSATYINQVTTNQQTNITNITNKTHEQPVKLIYPSSGQTLSTTGVVNVNNRLSFPTQTVGHLPNGSLGVTTQTVLQTTSGLAHNIGSITQSNSQSGSTISSNVNKQQGGQTALVIKTSAAPGGMVSVPMSVPVSVAGNNSANTTLQGKPPGVTSTIVPSNVQILNVNTMRPGTPVAGQQPGKPVASRVVIGQHMVGARPGAPGITLQALQGLQPGTQGHLLLKTENGQYQLLRVGPAPTTGTPGGGTVTSNSITGGAVVTPGGGTTFRLASVPAVSRLNTQFTGPPLATLRKPVQTVATSVTTVTATPGTVTTVAAAAPVPAATKVQTGPNPAQRQTTDNTKEKCRKFLANLLELSSREPKSVERNVRTLIQELIDTKVEPEEFCDRLERLLNASPQPCLIGFLKKSLPLLRQSLVTKDLVIEGIRPPPANVVFSIADNTHMAQVQNQLRPTVAVASTGHTAAGIATTQVRVMAPLAGTTTMVQRPSQPIQQRLIRPVVTMVRSPTAHTIKTTVAVSGIRPAAPTIQKPQVTNIMKTTANTAQGKTINATTTLNKAVVPSLVPKPTAKEKEKKTFSSAGYTGDDDINDVAAMGGVNLAEESQRILGSTEFVGTQIRSCKDEVFLHMTPLQQRIKQIVSSYGLEEPNAEVASLISHATQERLKNLVEKLAVIAEHRIDLIKVDPRYEVTQDVRAQLKFLEELDRVERRRHEEQERELLLRAAKSRAKTEDPEQAKLKAKAKEMQRAEMEELRQREANLTALQAIGPRKKPKLDVGGSSGGSGSGTGLNSSTSGLSRQMPMRPRLKRVNYRDLLFLLEQEKETCRSTTLYKSYLK